MKAIILSDTFYDLYGDCEELLKKENRPYIFLEIEIDGYHFAIPIRHNMLHNKGFHTIGSAGLDYTKSVIIPDDSFISDQEAIIDSKEWNIIKANEQRIIFEYKKYYKQYIRALNNPDNYRSKLFLQYSTLQYFISDK